MFLREDGLLKLYELYVGEEQTFIEGYQTRTKFYASIVIAIFAATVAGALKATAWHHCAFICTGPALSFVVSKIAVDGTHRMYRRFILTLTMRAKVEQLLGLTRNESEPEVPQKGYWANEPIVAPKHVATRKSYPTSTEFFREKVRGGYHLWTRRLFISFQVVSVILALALVARGIFMVVEPTTGSTVAGSG